MTWEARYRLLERLKHSQNKLKLRSYKIVHADIMDKRMKEKRLSRARQIIRLLPGVCLSKVLYMDRKKFTVRPLHNCQNRRQPFKSGQQKSAVANDHGPQSFPDLLMVYAGIWATDKTPWSSLAEMSESILPATSSKFQGTFWSLRVFDLWRRRVCASARLGSCVFGSLNDCYPVKVVSRPLRQ
ncbi:hypothetical protein KIN20_013021 [Parelaphostrongylus tenuis]|uniref:Uncharacterized protein n=1 Tax=Parelaphostrongylus tenuis TaxID=148309 RepID=A0AAD5MVJ1_PARTN|nr:hypothetical protein KIN20_013021 [Parelaphostrongylus tenuis]